MRPVTPTVRRVLAGITPESLERRRREQERARANLEEWYRTGVGVIENAPFDVEACPDRFGRIYDETKASIERDDARYLHVEGLADRYGLSRAPGESDDHLLARAIAQERSATAMARGRAIHDAIDERTPAVGDRPLPVPVLLSLLRDLDAEAERRERPLREKVEEKQREWEEAFGPIFDAMKRLIEKDDRAALAESAPSGYHYHHGGDINASEEEAARVLRQWSQQRKAGTMPPAPGNPYDRRNAPRTETTADRLEAMTGRLKPMQVVDVAGDADYEGLTLQDLDDLIRSKVGRARGDGADAREATVREEKRDAQRVAYDRGHDAGRRFQHGLVDRVLGKRVHVLHEEALALLEEAGQDPRKVTRKTLLDFAEKVAREAENMVGTFNEKLHPNVRHVTAEDAAKVLAGDID